MKDYVRLILMAALFISCSSSKKEQAPEAPFASKEAPKEAALPPVVVKSTEMAPSVTWAYQGVLGPDNWGDLSPEYSSCKSGKNQSPVHLIWSRPKTDQKLDFNYKHSNMTMTDTGFTVQIDVEKGNMATLHGQAYELEKIQFHTSSEHSLSGNILPMEVQLVHKNAQGDTAVVAFFAIEGQAHEGIAELWKFFPKEKHAAVNLNKLVNPLSLLPKTFHHYYYVGSLTTPPCTEDVKWFILNTPVTLSREQILAFRQMYSLNNRPIQPLNGRKIINY